MTLTPSRALPGAPSVVSRWPGLVNILQPVSRLLLRPANVLLAIGQLACNHSTEKSELEPGCLWTICSGSGERARGSTCEYGKDRVSGGRY